MDNIITILTEIGPSRSSKVAEILQARTRISPQNARQKISRSGNGVMKFPIPLLPNRESFIYLERQRTTEEFWPNFLDALRESNSIFGFAIDSLLAKGGIINIKEFAVFSGAPVALKKQVTSSRVEQTLEAAGVIRRENVNGEDCYVISRPELGYPEYESFKARNIIEDIMIDGVREWVRKMGLASYNSIAIRRENPEKRMVGAFKWDLTGPSYLLPLRVGNSKPGFFVADVFSGSTLDENNVSYIIRKSQLLKASTKNIRVLSMPLDQKKEKSLI